MPELGYDPGLLMGKPLQPRIAVFAIAVLGASIGWNARAIDYSDPADLLQRNREQNQAMQGTSLEVDGMIEGMKPGNPGWYSIYLELDNGDQLTLIVYPKTNFWLGYKPLAPADAYPRFVHGQKIRIKHNTFLDAYLKHEMITDMMFVP